VMAALIISILSDSSKESMGSHAPRVILFGAIPAIIPIILEVPIVLADPIVASDVGTVLVVLPTGLLDLVDYSSSSDPDPSEDSLHSVPNLPLVSCFLCSDDLEADSESEPAEQRPVSSSHKSLNHHLSFHLHLLLPHPGFVDVQQLLSDPVRLSLSVDLTASTSMGRVDSSSSSSPSDHSLSGHTPPNTTDVDTSTPPMLIHLHH
ncbi:hypothetical protein Tco_0920628, partial [Tanacetum coccineum]